MNGNIDENNAESKQNKKYKMKNIQNNNTFIE